GGFGMFKNAATALNVDQKTLISDLKSGKSLADIASSKGISKSTLISTLISAQKTALDKAVSNGKLTADQETKILANANTRISKMVDQKGLPKMDFNRGKDGFRMFKNAATALNVDQKTLINDLKSGKSLADIASSKGISKSTLISNLVAAQKAALDKAVSNGKLTADQETKILANATTRITKMVDQKGLPKMDFKRDGHRGGRGERGSELDHSSKPNRQR
ncbi:MAG: hypothetical protein Q8906_13775, partial [Bacillota bacterium]|nr:hypothetical protein [Bacillota bacterium]